MLKTAAEVGISEAEFWKMLPREFYRRLRAHNKRRETEEDAAWSRALIQVNTIRNAFSTKKVPPITLEELKIRAEEGGKPTKREVAEMWEKIEERRSIRAEA